MVALLAAVLIASVMMVVTPSFPAKSVKELIAIAKARPGEVVFASSGAGSNLHLALELFRDQAGIKITHVPYKGAGPAVTDVIGGQAQGMFADLPVLTPYIKAGRLRAMAVAGAERTAMFPQVPALKELGFPRFNARQWYGMFAPAGTPREIVQKLHDEIARRVLAKDQTGWLRWLPGLHVLRHYELAWLPHDVMAGLALTAVLIPVGIAYAVAPPGTPSAACRFAALLAQPAPAPARSYASSVRDV
jgi:hypothetical protein